MFQTAFDLIVDGSFTDINGHVNNSRYNFFTDQARMALQREMGIPDLKLKENDLGLYVVETQQRFRQQLYAGDEITVRGTCKAHEGIKLLFDYEIAGPQGLAYAAQTKHVFFDREKKKPLRLDRIAELYMCCKNLTAN